ncbi:thiamine pyrophosphate-dependent enzyme [Prauserella flavalba]|uniref:thiamine pyrophosphate-dependent enzyme n=1 Tax=Prauserella flavalba TaxID=1477506 RepID=UPI0036ED05E6
MPTVKDAFFDVLRDLGMTRIFSNPGSTEVDLLVDLPADIEFVLGLHEGAVVGMATGWAIGSGRPALALLHTTAGLGNAVGALATARENRAPLVVVVGQQDRRHLAAEPFLTGQLEGLAGSYPVWTTTPVRASDVPSLVARAYHEARVRRGPALVVVPMDDWQVDADESRSWTAPRSMTLASGVDEDACQELATALDRASSPVVVAGARADDSRCWAALTRLAERLRLPVWQEAFGARAGFPQTSAHFAGHLPANRSDVRAALAEHDFVLVVGAPSLRQYRYEPGPFFGDGVEVAVVSDDPADLTHSTADLAIVTPLGGFLDRLADLVGERPSGTAVLPETQPLRTRWRPGETLLAQHVFGALAERLAPETILVEESPSTRLDLQKHVPASRPLGFLSAAMGGLGFAFPAAIGVKMAQPHRPVVAVVGDGSSLYGIQALWSAQRYGLGVLFVVLSNGGYAIMNHLAQEAGGKAPWPDFADVNVAGLATALGCPAKRVTSYEEMVCELDALPPGLAELSDPFVLDVVVGTSA